MSTLVPEQTKPSQSQLYPPPSTVFPAGTVPVWTATVLPVASPAGEERVEEEPNNTGLLVVSILLMVVIICLAAFLMYKEKKAKDERIAALEKKQVRSEEAPVSGDQEAPAEALAEQPQPQPEEQQQVSARSLGLEGSGRSLGLDESPIQNRVDHWGPQFGAD
jgi:hypothetical protein